jgi:uncharacterized protein (TIGR02594 family)
MLRYLLAAVLSLGLTTAVVQSSAEAAPKKQTVENKKKAGIKKKKNRAYVKKKHRHRAVAKKKAPVQQVAKAPVEQCWFLFWEVPCTHNGAETTEKRILTGKTVPAVADGSKNIQTAKKYEGLHARKDRQKVAKIISEPFDRPIDPVRTPWCAAFANYILQRNGYEGTDSLLARSFLDYGVPTKDPKPGDIVVLKRGRAKWAGHVGFYLDTVEEDGVKYIVVLGGNQKKAVQVSYYPANRVLGYRQPVAS